MSVSLGVLLLAAALLKLGGRDVSAVPQVGWFSAPWLQVAAAEWEILLGLWLISGLARRAASLAGLVTFVVFAGVSGTLGWQGVASCGCFGTIQASPWWAFGIDIAAILLLGVSRPRADHSPRMPAGVAVAVLIAVAALAVSAAAGTLVYGSPAAAMARLGGDSLHLAADYLDFGDGKPGERLTAEVRVRNFTDRPLRLIGGTADCSCVTTSDLPITLPPRGEAAVSVQLKLPESRGRFTRVAEFWTDCDDQRTLRLRLGARVME